MFSIKKGEMKNTANRNIKKKYYEGCTRSWLADVMTCVCAFAHASLFS